MRASLVDYVDAYLGSEFDVCRERKEEEVMGHMTRRRRKLEMMMTVVHCCDFR